MMVATTMIPEGAHHQIYLTRSWLLTWLLLQRRPRAVEVVPLLGLVAQVLEQALGMVAQRAPVAGLAVMAMVPDQAAAEVEMLVPLAVQASAEI